MPTFTEAPNLSSETKSRARRLAYVSYSGLTVGAVLYWFNSPWPSMLLNALAILICIAGIVPMLRWLQRNDESYPLLEVLQLTMIPFYALPLITEHEEVLRYSESTVIRASWAVLLFQLSCLLGGVAANFRYIDTKRMRWWMNELVTDDNLRFTSYTLVLTTLWQFIGAFTHWTPPDLAGTLRAVFFGIGIISGFILARLWGSSQLNQPQKINFVINIFLQLLLTSLGLLLITALVTLLLVLVGYFSTARRVPWAICLVALPVFALLHSGKHKMREIYWGDDSHDISVAEVPGYYKEWFGYGWKEVFNSGHDETKQQSSLLERASLLQIVCHIIEVVPDHTPYLDGETYSYILPQIFPRFIWPDKPSPNDSVKVLSVQTGMLSPEEAETTSIGFGLIAEAYANFGSYAIVVLGFFMGLALRTVARATALCRTLSAGGIFRILCLAWCLNAETTLAVWLSSLYQACIAIFVPLFFYRSIFGD
jgi:hypothetical protein